MVFNARIALAAFSWLLVASVLPAAVWSPDLSRVPDTSWASGYSTIWAAAGYPGGIPTTTQHGSTITSTGDATDRTATINAALLAAALASSEGDIKHVLLGPGNFYVTTITGYSGAVLKGTAATGNVPGGQTTLISSSSSVFSIGQDTYFGNPNNYTQKTITSSLDKGDTVITISGDASEFIAGHGAILKITTPNPDVPVTAATGLYEQTMLFKIVSKSGNDITVTPALPADYLGGTLKPSSVAFAGNFGLEDITLQGGTSGITIEGADGAWFRRIKIQDHTNRGINATYVLRVSFVDSWIDAPDVVDEQSNHGGIILSTTTGWLIQNNIISQNFPAIQSNSGVALCNISYNYTFGASKGIQPNHNPWNSFNLFEGNISQQAQWDGYFGGGSHDTAFRNWFFALNQLGNPISAVRMDRFGRQHTLFGNLLQTPGETYTDDGLSFGLPNISNSSFTGTANASGVAPWDWRDWNTTTEAPKTWAGTLTTRTNDTEGIVTMATAVATDFETSVSNASSRSPNMSWSGGSDDFMTVGTKSGDTFPVTISGATLPAQDEAVSFATNLNFFQEKDLAVEATAVVKENYSVYSAGIISGQSIGADTQPDSMYLSAKPSWFGSLTWPPFNSRSPGTPTNERIPAGYLYVNNAWPSGSEATTISGTLTVNGTITLP